MLEFITNHQWIIGTTAAIVVALIIINTFFSLRERTKQWDNIIKKLNNVEKSYEKILKEIREK